jgi:hypothetical protein
VSAIFTSTVPAGPSVNSNRYTTSTAGTYRWQATYNGDANNAVVGPTLCSDPSGAVVVSKSSPSLSVTAPAAAAGMIHASVNLYGYGPTGSLAVFLTPPNDTFCSGPPVFTATVPVNGSGTYSSASYTPTVSGTYKWRASYSGDANNHIVGVSGCLDSNAAVTVTVNSSSSAAVSFSPSSVGFASQTVGTTSASQNVTVTNQGNAVLNITSVSVTGPNAAEFHLNAGTCGATVAPGATCSLAVSFAPSAPGARNANLAVADNAPGSPQTLALTGTGTTPTQASFAYPHDGQTGVDTTKPFTWTPVPGAQSYVLIVGVTMYRAELVNSGSLPGVQTGFNVPDLPTGRTLFATLFTQLNGNWYYQAISFTAAASQASFTNPLNGQANVDTTKPFTWSTSPGAEAYLLAIGTAPNTADVFNSGILPASQSAFTVGPLPPGRVLYGLLFTKVNGGWTRVQVIGFIAQ